MEGIDYYCIFLCSITLFDLAIAIMKTGVLSEVDKLIPLILLFLFELLNFDYLASISQLLPHSRGAESG